MAFFHAFEEFLAISDHTRLYHLPEQVISFTRPFSHSGKDRKSIMFLCNIVYEFLDKDGLADSGAAEKTDFSALEIWFEQVNNLYACVENLL